MIKRMQLYTTSTCQLRCEFCPRSLENYQDPKVSMGMDSFKEYVDKCIEFGITEFELSPLIGEALFDKQIFERVAYINSKAETEIVFFFTNMLKLTPEVLELSKKYAKFSFKLSIYGSNAEQYQQRTGVNAFDKMIQSIKLILEHSPRIEEIDLRYEKLEASKTDIKFRVLSKALFDKYNNEVYAHEDVNWKTDLMSVTKTLNDEPTDRSHEIKAGHACPFLEVDIGIWPDGDIGICSCWFDVNKKMILGNINEEKIDTILNRVEKYKKEQQQGLFRSLCAICTYPLR